MGQPVTDAEKESTMSKTSFTPGPWELCTHLQSIEKDAGCGCGYRGGIWGSDGEHIVCEMGGTEIPGEEALTPPRYDRQTEIANAHLIGAAADLFNVAEYALDAMCRATFDLKGRNCKDLNNAIKMARAAITKAKGE